MAPSQSFGVVVRTIGLLMIMAAIPSIVMSYLTLGLVIHVGPPVLWNEPGHRVAYPPNWGLLLSVGSLLIGIWFLRGGRMLVAFAYPKARAPGPLYHLAADLPASGEASSEN